MLPIEHAGMGNRFEVETPHERQAAVTGVEAVHRFEEDIPKQ